MIDLPTDTVGAFVGPPALLAPGVAGGPLDGCRLAVKDLFDVVATVTGAGNPAFAETRAPATANAPAVQRLVNAGATVVGKTITDELAWSLAGTNVHYGMPRNVAAPGRVPGGSSAGSAAAVAAGLADLALGTDTGGSVRIPASYCGIFGWRPTHGSVPSDGVVPLAPSFDVVGLFARRIGLLMIGAQALLGLGRSGGDPAPSASPSPSPSASTSGLRLAYAAEPLD
ncbi:MAG: amidase family protein, partial [Ilumatobacteraceae bacterium]